MGFLTAIDEFCAGYSSIGLLSKFQPEIVKIDMELIRSMDAERVTRLILASKLHMLRDLGIKIVCEGIQTAEEPEVLRDMGVELMQGFFPGPALARVADSRTCTSAPAGSTAEGRRKARQRKTGG
jgi:EAL domain-containing protein (putative c-di-GMP-specific phosphodiesterase class I)